MDKAVLLVTFNRLNYTKEVFKQIAIAQPPRLYIASDGPRPNREDDKEKIDEVRKYVLEHINWPCELKTRFLETNSGGCGIGVSSAVTWLFENEEDGIILEDDCVPSQSFFSYCEILLNKYKDDKDVYSIVGYNPGGIIKSQYDYEFSSMGHCWGWASWRKKWKDFSFNIDNIPESACNNFSSKKVIQQYWKKKYQFVHNKEVDAWDYQWFICIAYHCGLTIFPRKNLITNIGDEGGIHYDSANSLEHVQSYELSIEKFNDTKQVSLMNKVLWDYFFNKKIDNKKYTRFYLFGCVPLYTIAKTNKVVRHYLFGFIPFLKIRKK